MALSDIVGTGTLAVLTVAQTLHIIVKRWQARKVQVGDPEANRRRYDVLLERRLGKMESRLEQSEQRMDHAGEEMSKLATKLQGLPTEFHRYFASKEVATSWAESCQRERRELRDEIGVLRDEIRVLRDRPGPRAVGR